VILDGHVKLDGDVVRRLGIKRHVLVLGHEVDVVRDVHEGYLDVKALGRDVVKLAKTLDDGHVLLLDDVARGEDDGGDDDDQDEKAEETHDALHSVRADGPLPMRVETSANAN